MIEQADTTGKGIIHFRDFLTVMSEISSTRERSGSGQVPLSKKTNSFRRASSRDLRKKRFLW